MTASFLVGPESNMTYFSEAMVESRSVDHDIFFVPGPGQIMSRGIRIVEEEAPMEEKSIPTREVIKGEEGERHEGSIIRPTVSSKQKRIQSQVYSHKLLFSHGGGNVAEDLKNRIEREILFL